jgi:hypothetical protein
LRFFPRNIHFIPIACTSDFSDKTYINYSNYYEIGPGVDVFNCFIICCTPWYSGWNNFADKNTFEKGDAKKRKTWKKKEEDR